MDRLSGKVALVSGGARGMATSHARAMVAECARVPICDLLNDDGWALAAELGPSATYVPHGCDEAGRLGRGVKTAPDRGVTRDQWDQIIAINLTGVVNGIKAAVSAFMQNPGGSIINISSSAGMHAIPQRPGYIAAKFAVRG